MRHLPDHDLELEDYDEEKALPTHALLEQVVEDDPLNDSPPDSPTATSTTTRPPSSTPSTGKTFRLTAVRDGLRGLGSFILRHRVSFFFPPEDDIRPTAFLDGLRGLAALIVYIGHHMSWFYGPEDEIWNGYGAGQNRFVAQFPFIRIFFTGSNAAVPIFFVLSGYVLSISPLRLLRDGNLQKCYTGLVSATVRRPFRLFLPAVGVAFIFMLCMHLPFGLAPILSYPAPKETLAAELSRWLGETANMMNPFVAHGPHEHWYIYDPPAWTMPVEFAGSIVIFSLLALFGRLTIKHRALLFAAAGVVFILTYHWSMACFMTGVVLAINDLENLDHSLSPIQLSPLGKQLWYHFIFLSGWYLSCQPIGDDPSKSLATPGWWLLTQLTPPNYYSREFYRWWHTWGASMLVYGVLRINWLHAFFATKPLRYLGKVSFSLYLVHMPLIMTLSDRIYRFFGLKRQVETTTVFDDLCVVPRYGPRGLDTQFLVCQSFILPLSLFFAQIATVLLDQPSIKVGRWVVDRLKIGAR